MKVTEPIRNKQHIQLLMSYYLNRGQIRNGVLIVMGLHTALRISDLLALKWDDIYDFRRNRMRKSVTLSERKTGKPTVIALHRNVLLVLSRYADVAQPGRFLFENRRTGKAISRVQAYRIIRAAAEAVGIPHPVACHSLRKTLGYFAWQSGVSPAILVEIYNHSSLAVTRRYLGVTQDDKNAVYLNLDLSA